MTAATDVLTARPRKHFNDTLTADEVARSMRQVNRSRRSAQKFLKEIGVSFTKTGKISVRPV